MRKSQVRAFGSGLTPDGIILLNRCWDQEFEEYLYDYCRKHIRQNTRYPGFKNVLEQFADELSLVIDQDITMDCLDKIEYRTRLKKIQKLFPENVPSLKTA
jgi:hypothetical protein